MTDTQDYDVIIIGGSYAGLSAAMALGRSLRHTLIIDSGVPCNRQTPQSHNFITHDGEKPGVIAEKAKEQVLKYPGIKFHRGLAISGKKTGNRYAISTQAGEVFTAGKLIFATGVKDIMPDIKGFSECWGISVIHCPYCHGYEFRGQKTAIMANGERAFHLTSLVHNLTDRITLLTRGKAEFDAGQMMMLDQNNIKIVEKELAEIEHEGGSIRHVVFEDGTRMDFDAAYAAIPFTQHSDIPVSLGCELTEHGFLKTDMFQKTNIEDIFACGDNTTMLRSVANAVNSGNIAGAIVNAMLAKEKFEAEK